MIYILTPKSFYYQIEARLKVRATHLANVLASDRLDLAGALAPEFPSVDGATPEFKGSAVIVRADSRDDAIAFLQQDIYVSEGVWDIANAQVFAVSFKKGCFKKKKKKKKKKLVMVIKTKQLLYLQYSTVSMLSFIFENTNYFFFKQIFQAVRTQLTK
jgi:uncharacterized protein YciI